MLSVDRVCPHRRVCAAAAVETIFDELQELGYERAAKEKRAAREGYEDDDPDGDGDDDDDTPGASGGDGSGDEKGDGSAAAWRKGPVDFVLCVGNFMDRDEDVFTIFNELAETYVIPPLPFSCPCHQQRHFVD
jgi:hypothetical protein